MISAKVIADSAWETTVHHRVTTLEVEFPRIILAEFNTHRRFSRSSASSRAIPVRKQLQRVIDDPFVPKVFGLNKSGMQSWEPHPDQEACRIEWLLARDAAVRSTSFLGLPEAEGGLNVHKQWASRLLEPFMWHKVIVTSTEWDNFWRQRCSPLAQPEMTELADAMATAFADSSPQYLITELHWHLPYIEEQDRLLFPFQADLMKLSVARSCRVSYLNHDNQRDYEDELRLFEHLTTQDPPHAAPLEHPCKPSFSFLGDRNFGPAWIQARQLLGM